MTAAWLLVEHFDGSAHCHEIHGDVAAQQRELARPGHVRSVTQVDAPPPESKVYRSASPGTVPQAVNLRSEEPPLDQLPTRRLDRRAWARRGAR